MKIGQWVSELRRVENRPLPLARPWLIQQLVAVIINTTINATMTTDHHSLYDSEGCCISHRSSEGDGSYNGDVRLSTPSLRRRLSSGVATGDVIISYHGRSFGLIVISGARLGVG